MIRLNAIYPYSEGARFDYVYFRDRHMALVADRLGSACLRYTVDKVLSGGMPGAPLPYLASCSIHFESVEALEQAMRPHAREIMADVRNYTDIQPVFWISDIDVDRSPSRPEAAERTS